MTFAVEQQRTLVDILRTRAETQPRSARLYIPGRR